MKKIVIENIIRIVIGLCAAGLVFIITEKSFYETKNDEIDLKNEQIKNLESKIISLEKLNSIYKTDFHKTPDNEVVKTTSTGVSMGGKSLSIDELIDYTNKIRNERNEYKSKYELLSDYYGLDVYEKDGYYSVSEKRNGKIFMLNKEVYVQKSIIEQFQKKLKRRIEYNINDSIVTFKEYPMDN